ncbi:MAG: DUF1636 family protein [Hyphomicrobiaceae bacterium]
MPDEPDSAGRPSVTIFVCESCGDAGAGPADGAQLLANLRSRNSDPDTITVTGVDCLAVCEQPVSVAFAADGKWSYVLGDVKADTDVADILAAAKAVAVSPYGVPAMEDRPRFFRDGVVSRVPPAGWEMPV